MYYETYTDPVLIDCKPNDKVYVYKRKVLDERGEINEHMIGLVEYIHQIIWDDWTAASYLEYDVTIRMQKGKVIRITDNQLFFRRYEFITLKDLKKLYGIEVE